MNQRLDEEQMELQLDKTDEFEFEIIQEEEEESAGDIQLMAIGGAKIITIRFNRALYKELYTYPGFS